MIAKLGFNDLRLYYSHDSEIFSEFGSFFAELGFCLYLSILWDV